MVELGYLFRKPKFPLICNIDGYLVGAKSIRMLESQIDGLELSVEKLYPTVDSTGEDWALVAEHMILSPLTIKKRWTKKQIIDMFNSSLNAKTAGIEYSTKSISCKRLDLIVSELVDIILNANKRLQKSTQHQG